MDKIFTSGFKYSLIGLLVITGLFFARVYDYLLFHSLTEIFAICIAGGIFILAITAHKQIDNKYLIFLGIAYLFVGFINLLHTLSYSGMGVMKDHGVNTPTQLWIFGRYLESFSLLAAAFFIKRKVHIPSLFAVYSLITAVGMLSILSWQNFPACFIEGQGLTPFKIASEYIICVMLALSGWLLMRQGGEFDPVVRRFILFSIFITIISELSFTLYEDPYGLMNMIGHFLEVISFYLIYLAVIVTGVQEPTRTLFRKLKENETYLTAERTKLNMILESMGDNVYSVDPDYNVIYANPIMEKKFGKIDGRKCYQYLYNKDSVCSWCRNEEVLKGNVVHREMDNLPDGRIYDMLETPMIGEDGSAAVMKILRDITERKEAEEVLRRDKMVLASMVEQKSHELVKTQDKLARAKRLSDMGELAAVVAHELRHPLSVMNVGLFNMKKKAESSVLDKYINRIETKIMEADNIINNLLNYTRIRIPDRKIFNTKELLDGTIASVKDQFSSTLIKIEKDIDLIEKIKIEADPQQLKEVFSNIMINACQAVDEKKGRIKVSASADNGKLIVDIADNGCGIGPEDLEHIFDKFFTTKSKGTGLGLSICKEYAELNGGTIKAASEKGKGTVFTIELPVDKKPE
jgi:PAS domain S-box-containing protein